ncbi:MAG: FixH family protein [Flavobacteriales bacterium]|nr:FixH family protein [Flavobacteriales bacterium]
MNINWGWKLTIVYVAFAAGILTLVFKAKGQKVDLVTPDYYKQELAFSGRLDATRNASALSAPVKFEYAGEAIAVTFPTECVGKTMDGQITIYCPSDASLDRTLAISTDASGTQWVSSEGLKKGFYVARASWKMDDKNYYAEEAIQVQ